ncbi:MAG: DUF5107 domain-containing protein [Planctomycetota bacterium]|nr:DUF5107 domain-containing protein [Planctomycetota bacterium]
MPNAPVRLFEKTLKLPGYPPGPDERVPLFFQDGHIRIYPYPLRDHITFKKQTLQVRALGLENEHVRVLVTPCFGGHVWSFYDKRRKREVFYTPDLVKPGLIRLPGAWMPLGLEFNFPNGHTPMSMSPVAASARKLPDGAAGIVVGDVDLMTRMRWQVEVSLRPGVAAMDVSVRLSNPMPRRQRWYFWANAGVEVSEGWQFLCPARYGREAWTGGQFDFPVHRGRDVTRYTNYDGGGEVFVAGVAEDFFGCYDHDSGEGIVHVADWRAMRGKKFFTWGSGPEGKVWGRMFCDKPVRHYAEIQCGPLETQADREWFPPYGERSWSDRWYPVAGTGPFFFATAQLALGVRGAGAKRKLTLFPCEDLGPATLELRLGKAVRRTRLTLRAGRRAEAACGGEGVSGRACGMRKGACWWT